MYTARMVDSATGARIKARTMLFDLYGDFAVEEGRAGVMRLGALVRLATSLGVNEMAVRSAKARMVQEGWLCVETFGRESAYALTERGQQEVERGRQRLFTDPDAWWNGTWYVVALSVPEARRDVRDRLRRELLWLGFGSPSSSLYVSTHDYREDAVRLAREADALEFVQVYQADAFWPQDPRRLVEKAWGNLAEVNGRYEQFLNTFAPQLARIRAQSRADELDERTAFNLRFALATQFRACLGDDPDLPLDLLPAAWNGVAARLLFREFYSLVSPAALSYFNAVCASTTPSPRSARTSAVRGRVA
jgi:phenylacetic acid degradation operon negative regulatory protein